MLNTGASSPSPLSEDRETRIQALLGQLRPHAEATLRQMAENAKTELASRRAEMLARQAEELKGLDTDQAQLDTGRSDRAVRPHRSRALGR